MKTTISVVKDYKKEYDDLIRALEKAKDDNDRQQQYKISMRIAKNQVDQNQLKKAEMTYRNLLVSWSNDQPKQARIQCYLGDVLRKLNRVSESLDLYRDAQQYYKTKADAANIMIIEGRINRCDHRTQGGREKDALAKYMKHTKKGEGLVEIANAALELGRLGVDKIDGEKFDAAEVAKKSLGSFLKKVSGSEIKPPKYYQVLLMYIHLQYQTCKISAEDPINVFRDCNQIIEENIKQYNQLDLVHYTNIFKILMRLSGSGAWRINKKKSHQPDGYKYLKEVFRIFLLPPLPISVKRAIDTLRLINQYLKCNKPTEEQEIDMLGMQLRLLDSMHPKPTTWIVSTFNRLYQLSEKNKIPVFSGYTNIIRKSLENYVSNDMDLRELHAFYNWLVSEYYRMQDAWVNSERELLNPGILVGSSLGLNPVIEKKTVNFCKQLLHFLDCRFSLLFKKILLKDQGNFKKIKLYSPNPSDGRSLVDLCNDAINGLFNAGYKKYEKKDMYFHMKLILMTGDNLSSILDVKNDGLIGKLLDWLTENNIIEFMPRNKVNIISGFIYSCSGPFSWPMGLEEIFDSCPIDGGIDVFATRKILNYLYEKFEKNKLVIGVTDFVLDVLLNCMIEWHLAQKIEKSNTQKSDDWVFYLDSSLKGDGYRYDPNGILNADYKKIGGVIAALFSKELSDSLCDHFLSLREYFSESEHGSPINLLDINAGIKQICSIMSPIYTHPDYAVLYMLANYFKHILDTPILSVRQVDKTFGLIHGRTQLTLTDVFDPDKRNRVSSELDLGHLFGHLMEMISSSMILSRPPIDSLEVAKDSIIQQLTPIFPTLPDSNISSGAFQSTNIKELQLPNIDYKDPETHNELIKYYSDILRLKFDGKEHFHLKVLYLKNAINVIKHNADSLNVLSDLYMKLSQQYQIVGLYFSALVYLKKSMRLPSSSYSSKHDLMIEMYAQYEKEINDFGREHAHQMQYIRTLLYHDIPMTIHKMWCHDKKFSIDLKFSVFSLVQAIFQVIDQSFNGLFPNKKGAAHAFPDSYESATKLIATQKNITDSHRLDEIRSLIELLYTPSNAKECKHCALVSNVIGNDCWVKAGAAPLKILRELSNSSKHSSEIDVRINPKSFDGSNFYSILSFVKNGAIEKRFNNILIVLLDVVGNLPTVLKLISDTVAIPTAHTKVPIGIMSDRMLWTTSLVDSGEEKKHSSYEY